MKCWWTMPIPTSMASLGDPGNLPPGRRTWDGSPVRPLHAVQDLHEGRLAGTVLADDRVNLTAFGRTS